MLAIKITLSFLIDLMLAGGAGFILMQTIASAASFISFPTTLPYLLAFAECAGFFFTRDVLFGGASPGKRLFSLVVKNAQTNSEATDLQKLLRCFPFDLLFLPNFFCLIISGKTIGDRIAKTTVENRLPEDAHMQTSKKKRHVRTILISGFAAAFAVLAFFILFHCFVGALDFNASLKESDEYRLAHSFLVNSDAFLSLNVPENEIRFSGYGHAYTSDHIDAETIKYIFKIEHSSCSVFLHKIENAYSICDECTLLP